MIGQRIGGRYEVLAMIGGGGMANVYRARDMILERDVAVKVLQPQYTGDEEFIRRFRREAQAATSLVHANVVDIYDVGEEENLFYIVMAYIGGNTLKDKIARVGPLPFSEALSILNELTAAIAYAHEQGIIHRDLKPQNILLEDDGTVKVTDFGIARAASAATITHTNSVLGSVHYLSPEQARGGVVTAKTDIYALGVILYEMVTGNLPYDADSAVSIALKHLQEPFPDAKMLRNDLPGSINNMIRRATAKDPMLRYPDVHAMRLDAETALSPGRLHEPLVSVEGSDDEITKSIPILNDHHDVEETKVPEASNPEDTNEQAPPKKKRKRKLLLIFGIVFLLLLSLVAAVTLIPALFGVDEVEVPEVVGMESETAEEALSELGLEVATEVEFHDEVEENEVFRQSPEAGRNVMEGSTVTITVSDGLETIEMPDLAGLQVERAEELLTDFESVELVAEPSSEYSPDLIIGQDPEAGEEVAPVETTVTLTYSETPEITLDDLTGTSQEAVNNYLETHNLAGTFQRAHSDTVSEDHVISQDPAPYVTVAEGSEINFIISDGPEPQEEEENPSQTVEAVIPVEVSEGDEDASYEIRIMYEDSTTEEPEVFEEEEITSSTTYRVPLIVTPDEDGSYTLFVNDEEVQSNTFSYEN